MTQVGVPCAVVWGRVSVDTCALCSTIQGSEEDMEKHKCRYFLGIVPPHIVQVEPVSSDILRHFLSFT